MCDKRPQPETITVFLCQPYKIDSAVFDAFKNVLQNCGFQVETRFDAVSGKSFVPVFLTTTEERLRQAGFRIPKEFIVETWTRYEHESRMYCCEALDCSIKERILTIAGSMNRDLRFDPDLRDWCIGALRQYYYLDENVHGVGQLDLDKMTIEEKPACGDLYARVNAPNDVYKFLKPVFKTDSDAIENAVRKWNEEGGGTNSPSAEEVSGKIKALPYFSGMAVKYLSPRGRLSALVINNDRNAATTLGRFPIESSSGGQEGQQPDQPLPLEAFIKFDDFIGIGPESNESIDWSVDGYVRVLREKLADDPLLNLKYNLIVLDLCLGEQGQGDLTGYHLLPVLRQFFPHIPIVIHSQFEDMGHIVRAFKLGASWFLPRKYAGKLPRHMLQIFSNPNWKREWRSLSRYIQVKSCQGVESLLWSNAEREKCQYLIACITRDLPGRVVNVESMHSGVGGSKTFRVSKGEKQTSLIVKMDTSYSMFMERERYLRFIRPYIDNCAGRVYAPAVVLDQFHAAIAYTFAGGVDGRVKTDTLFQIIRETLLTDCDDSVIEPIITKLLGHILPKLHTVAIGSSSDSSFQDADWPNAAQDEYPDPRSVYSWRMPTMRTVVIDTPVPPDDKRDETVEMVVYKSFRATRSKRALILGIEFPEDRSYPTTVALKGNWIDHITQYRHILPQMLLRIPKDGHSEPSSAVWMTFCKSETPFRTIIRDIAARVAKTPAASKRVKAGPNGDEWLGETIDFIRDDLLERSKPFLEQCPKGIMHGDLNCGNVMIDCVDRVFNGNIWLIDFARTRRGPVIFDYSVLFTSVLSMLVEKEFVRDEKYLNHVGNKEIWGSLINHAVFNHPNSFAFQTTPLPSLVFIEKILVQIRSGIKQYGDGLLNAYPYAVALNLLFLTRILYLDSENEKNVASQAMLAGALIIYEELLEKEKRS